MPLYVLDTDVCIYLLNGKAPVVAERLRTLSRRSVGTAAITVAELTYGALHSARPQKNLQRVNAFLTPLQRFPFDDKAALQFGIIKHDLATRGVLIGPMDLLIASTALSLDATLVTHNLAEFKRVTSLRVEDWML